MLPDRVSNPGPLTYESGALPIALRGPASFSGHKLKPVGIVQLPCKLQGNIFNSSVPSVLGASTYRAYSKTLIVFIQTKHLRNMGWSGVAMVLGKLTVPGRPTNLD